MSPTPPAERDIMTPSATQLINQRYSCRTYLDEPIDPARQRLLADYLAANTAAPFGSRARFALVAANAAERAALKGLGTYGFIKGATGFVVGAVERGPKALEDYGYLLERAVLYATGLDLGTCWLGGTMKKSAFAGKIGVRRGEIMPAVVSVGNSGDDGTERIREREAGSGRLPASRLSFDRQFGAPLTLGAGDPFVAALDAVRMAPSASNKQPWRVVRAGDDWHFYLQRTKRYGKGSLVYTVLRLADLQRVDLGIALCHFELAARQQGLAGAWVLDEPAVTLPQNTEYTATWRGAAAG
jgi:hypothetical protein